MKVVLLKDLENLGEAHEVIRVADGYGRNYLLPRKLAILATQPAEAAAKKRQEKRLAELEKRRNEFVALAEKLSSLQLEIAAPAGEGEKLFGSVAAQDIVDALKTQAEIEVDKRKVVFSHPIKTIGEYTVNIKIFQEINADLKIKVIKQ